MEPAMVRVRSLRKAFGTHEVLRGIDLDVRRSETMAVIGPSGAGKSMLLRCINHLEPPSGGSVEIDGVPVASAARSRRARERHLNAMRTQVGMVFQRFNLFPHRTALGNVMEGPLVVRRMPREARGGARPGHAGAGRPCATRPMPIPASSPAASSSAWRLRAPS